MLSLLLALAWAGIVTWLVLRATRQFRAYRVLKPLAATADGPTPRLTVIVPARNEADVIGRCLEGLAAQDYPADRFRVIVVDDGSTDATAARARAAVGGDPRFTMIEAAPLPPGWTGKTHACWCGAAAAGGDWLCFIDADTVPEPPLLRTAIAAAVEEKLDLLSLEPRQELVTVWERLVIPAGLFALGFARDLRRIDDPTDQDAAANGQFLLVRRALYEAVGGHSAVRASISEDSLLARVVKARGGRIGLSGGALLISARMYRNLRALCEGVSKNSTETLGGVRATLTICGLGLPLAWTTFALPVALAAVLGGVPAAGLLSVLGFGIALSASLAAIGLHMAGAHYMRIPAWYGLIFPIGYTFAALLAFDGLRQQRRGRVGWKGRTYAVGTEPRPGGTGSP